MGIYLIHYTVLEINIRKAEEGARYLGVGGLKISY